MYLLFCGLSLHARPLLSCVVLLLLSCSVTYHVCSTPPLPHLSSVLYLHYTCNHKIIPCRSEGYISVGSKIKSLEHQLSLCDGVLKECDKTGKDAEKAIEEHFAWCMNALAERKAVLLRETAQTVENKKRSIEDCRVKLETSIAVCRQTLQAGSTSFTISPDTARTIWKSLAGMPVPLVSPIRRIIILPMTLSDAIQKHGEVVEQNSFSKAELVTTLAGSSHGRTDGNRVNARFSNPWGICFNPYDQCLYISDFCNNSIRKMNMQGDVTTFASGIVSRFVGGRSFESTDGVGLNASFTNPSEITIDQTGNLYVTEVGSHRIRKITPHGEVSTVAGSERGFVDGSGRAAKFNEPQGICYDMSSHSLLVCDGGNHKLRRVQLNGEVSTLCDIQSPIAVVVTANQTILVSSKFNLYKVIPEGSQKYNVEVVAGSGEDTRVDGTPDKCGFSTLRGLTVHEASHSCYGADSNNNAIRKISFVS